MKNVDGGYNFYSMDGSSMGWTKYENGDYIKFDKYGNYEYRVASRELDNLYEKSAVQIYNTTPNYTSDLGETVLPARIKPMDFSALDRALEAEAAEDDTFAKIRKINLTLNQYIQGDRGYIVYFGTDSDISSSKAEEGAGYLRSIGFTKVTTTSINGKHYVIFGTFLSNIEAQEWIKRCNSKLDVGLVLRVMVL